MKVGILGAGSMGGLFAGRLFRSGADVVLLDRNPELIETVRKNGLEVKDRAETYRLTVPIYDTREYDGQPDVLLLFVKAPSVEQAMLDAAKNIGERTMVVCLVNGLGHERHILPHVDASQILMGATALGAISDGLGRVRWTYEGETYIGPLGRKITEPMEEIRRLLERAGISTILTERVEDYIWTKLFINISYNSLTAITGLTNGELVGSETGRKLMNMLVDETAAVAKQLGIHPHYPDPMQAVIDIGRFIGPNRSTMLQDVLAGRRTEIDALNGAVARLGREAGVDVKANEIVTHLVKLIEEKTAKEVTRTNGV